MSRPCTCAYPDDKDPAAHIGCPKHGCTCPPHMDGIGREKWPDCPVHSLPMPPTLVTSEALMFAEKAGIPWPEERPYEQTLSDGDGDLG